MAKTVKILAVMPAKLRLIIPKANKMQMIGGILGAVAGGVIGNGGQPFENASTVVGVNRSPVPH